MNNTIKKLVADYYTGKVRQYGLDSKGVDWSSRESQYLRFQKLCEVFENNNNFSILDYGCGTGELLNFLGREREYQYHGYDISEEMINLARSVSHSVPASFTNELSDKKFDYVVGSGIFNVKLNVDQDEWLKYILDTLEVFQKHSIQGFSFNILSSYSDIEKRRSDLYYADPLYFFDYCKKNFSRFVTLVHDYPLYEFTIIVRKNI